MSHITPLDQEINAWYESQSEETLRHLQDRFDAQTPRECWHAFFNDCAFPAQQSPGDSLAAPAEAGQGVCIESLQPGDVRPIVIGATLCEDGRWWSEALECYVEPEDCNVLPMIELERFA